MTARPEISTAGRLRALFHEAGAHWLHLPVLHPADPFLETAGEDIRRRMFVTEGRTGDRLALRPDFTIPVCLHHLAHGAGPARYAYEGVAFRRHDTGSAERLETGYEDIGATDRVAADAEAIALALRGVATLGGGRLVTHLGDIGLFVAVLVALGLPEPWRRRLRRSFGVPPLMSANLERLSSAPAAGEEMFDAEITAASATHDREALVAILERRSIEAGYGAESGRSPAEIADRFLDRQALSETRIGTAALQALEAFLVLDVPLGDAPETLETFAAAHGLDLAAAVQAFAERAAAVHARVSRSEIRFVAGFGRPLDYYTGLVFEVRSEGFPHPLAGGGRYDRLMAMLGAAEPVPAVGFTIRLDEQARGSR